MGQNNNFISKRIKFYLFIGIYLCFVYNITAQRRTGRSLNELPNIFNSSNVSNHLNFHSLDEDYECGVFLRYDNFTDFPWMALIFDDKEKLRCGGSVINKRYILTAAHCVKNLRNGIVRVGAQNISRQTFGFEKIKSHPQYSKKNMENDIALIKLNKSIDFSFPGVRQICLPLMNFENPSFIKAQIAGWGISNESGPKQLYMKNMTVSIIPNEFCTLLTTQMRNYGVIKDTQMCVTTPLMKNICVGGSGGFLQKTREFDVFPPRYVQFGVSTSINATCATKNVPGLYIYTRVEYYMKWILDTIRN